MSAPDLNWSSMLNMTKFELEIISNADTYFFFQKTIRGGVCYISKRYREANNKHLKSYDTKQETKHITYLDANNFYGYAISKFPSTSGFKLIDPKDFDSNK